MVSSSGCGCSSRASIQPACALAPGSRAASENQKFSDYLGGKMEVRLPNNYALQAGREPGPFMFRGLPGPRPLEETAQ